MKSKTLIFLLPLAAIIGIVFFIVQRDLLIIHFTFTPFNAAQPVSNSKFPTAQHKKINVYYLKHDKWHHEEVSVIWHEHDLAQVIQHVIKQWLSILQDAHLLPPHISIESVAISGPGSDAYLSFDETLFDQNWSIMRKWSIIESLIKTLHMAEVKVQSIILLINQKPMHDDYIDLSAPIPLDEHL